MPSAYATAAGGTRIACRIRGEGSPLMLLAGQANSHHWWDSVLGDCPLVLDFLRERD